MFRWWRWAADPGEQNNVNVVTCEHKHWRVYGTNRITCGTCLDCQQEVPLDMLMDSLALRAEAILKKLEARIE